MFVDSNGSLKFSSNNDTSDKFIAPFKDKRKKVEEECKVGVDPSIGKDTRLFGVDLKHVANPELERVRRMRIGFGLD